MVNNIISWCLIPLLLSISVEGLSIGKAPHRYEAKSISTRRSILQQVSCFGIAAVTPFIHNIDAANAADAQFVEVGQQERPPDGGTPFSTLSNGVQIKDFREGAGGASVQSGSKVELTMKGRLLNLNGVIFYDTKSNDPDGFGEGTLLRFTVGDKSVLPGLESGISGMSKGGIRRIIVPADVGYGAFPGLEPQPMTEMEKRALDSVVKNPRRDQTVMFDVKLERVK